MDPHRRTTPVAKYMRWNGFALFAPLVRLADRMLDRWAPASDVAPILGPPPAPGWVPLRPDTRKVLAFDDLARKTMFGAAALLMMEVGAVGWFAAYVAHGRLAPLVGGILVSALTILGWTACIFYIASRVRELRSLFARCVVVMAHVTSAVPYATRQSMMVQMTLVYVCSGIRYQAPLVLSPSQSGLVGVGSMTQVIVDPQCLSLVFLRDFYT